MSKQHNVALIGAGGAIGALHIQAIKDNPGCRLYGLCDRNAERLAKVAEANPGTPLVVQDYREVMADPNVDIVIIASPDFSHAEHTAAAMAAGKHVLCEKPLALTMSDIDVIIKAVKAGHTKFMVGQVSRYAPGFVEAKRLVDEGRIGKLFFVESEYAHNYGSVPGVDNWRVNPDRDPVIGGGCHAVDLLRWVVGADMTKVAAFANHECLTDWPVNDCTIAIYTFANGVIGKILASIGCVRPYTMRSVFYGTEGTIICDNTRDHIELSCPKTHPEHKNDFVDIPVPIHNHNMTAELAGLVDAIDNDTPVPTDVFEGARTVAAAKAATESANHGGAIVAIENFR